MMTRITVGLFGSVIALTVLVYLYQLRPVYAFIGGVVGMVSLLVLYGLWRNGQSAAAGRSPEDNENYNDVNKREEVPAHRRTGEFQAIEDVEDPEENWDTTRLPAQQTPPEPPSLEEPITEEKPLPPAPSFWDGDVPKTETSEADNYGWLGGLAGEILPDAADEDTSYDLASLGDEDEIVTFGDIDMPQETDNREDGLQNRRGTSAPKASHTRPGGIIDNPIALAGQLPEESRQAFLNDLFALPSNQQTPEKIRAIFQKYVPNTHASRTPPVDIAQFTAYYPRQAAANTEYGFYVYAHLPDALVAEDVQQFSKALGGRVPKPKIAVDSAALTHGATLTAMVQCEDLQFNQVGSMQAWQAPFVRFDFSFTADDALIDETVKGRVAILLGMIEIASVDFQILVGAANPIAAVTAKPDNPLVGIGFEPSPTTSAYQTIFVSYAREDTAIATQYRQAQMMAGNIVFMDTHSIRAGEDWEAALKRFIDTADIFQLFWSPASAASEHVRFEWAYALEHRCPDTRCEHFIRPVYWQMPMPDVPDSLGHLHFAYVEPA